MSLSRALPRAAEHSESTITTITTNRRRDLEGQSCILFEGSRTEPRESRVAREGPTRGVDCTLVRG